MGDDDGNNGGTTTKHRIRPPSMRCNYRRWVLHELLNLIVYIYLVNVLVVALVFCHMLGENIIKYSKNVMDWAIKSPKIYLATNIGIHFLKDTFRFSPWRYCRQAEYAQYMCYAYIDRVTSPMFFYLLILISTTYMRNF